MKIGQNKVVEFCYELEVDGQVVDHTTKEKPLDYIHGTGSLLPKLGHLNSSYYLRFLSETRRYVFQHRKCLWIRQ